MAASSNSNVASLLAGATTAPNPTATNALGTLRPSMKRTMTSAQDLSDNLLASVKRFRGTSAVEPLRAALPAAMRDSMNVVNTGVADLGQMTDQIITWNILAKPYPEHWEKGFVEYTALWGNRHEQEYASTEIGQHTIADLPILNWAQELGSIVRSQGALMRRDLLGKQRQLYDYYAHLIADDADDFRRKWNRLGNMTTVVGGVHSSLFSNRAAHPSQRLLGFSPGWDRSYTFNVFASHIKKGDQLFYVVSDFDAPYRSFFNPRGEAIAGRTNFASRFLQIRGMTDTEMPFVPGDTSAGGAFDDADAPGEADADYMRRDTLAAQEYEPLEYDPEFDMMRVRDLIGQEGAQEALANVPQLVWEAYHFGTVYPIGVARHRKGFAPSHIDIMDALRSQPKMHLMQQVEIYGK
jgi:hypothetical protein